MSQASRNASGQGNRQESIRVSMPAAGTRVTVDSASQIALEFDAGTSAYAREGNDLVIAPENGGTLVITGFFTTGDQPLPDFVMVDGLVVASGDFLSGKYPDMDIATAAGPSSSSTPSSGVGDYSDGAGDLLGGVDRLGSLGTTQWGLERDNGERLLSSDPTLEAPAAPEPLPPLPPEPPVPPVPPEPPLPPDPTGPRAASGPYQARAILYTHDAQEGGMTPGGPHQVTAKALSNQGGAWSSASGVPSVSYDGGWNEEYITVTVNPDGSISFALTEEGLAFMRAEGRDVLDFYFKVQLPGGDAYLLQVVVADDRNFDSADADQWTQDNENVWGSLDQDGLVHGEWHQGTAGSTEGYAVSSSELADALSYTGEIRADGTGKTNSIHTNAGNDTLSLSGVLHAANDGFNNIEMGEGDDSLAISGMINADNDGRNVIGMGDGNDTATIAGNLSATRGGGNDVFMGSGDNTLTISGSLSADGGTNTLDAEDGEDRFTITGNVDSSNGGKTSIVTGGGNDTVTIGGNVTAGQNAENDIQLGTGDNSLTVGGTVSADSGENRISAEAGNDSISLGGMSAVNGGSNTVTSGAGDDTVSVVGGVSASGNGSNEIDLASGDNSLTVGGTVHADSGTNRINAEGGNDSISLGGMNAANGGSNTVTSGVGDDTVFVVGGVSASANGLNDIDLGSGDNSLTVGGTVHADSGTNRFSAEDGNDSISLGGMSAANGGSNTVNSGAGDDTVSVVGGVSASANGSNEIDLASGDNTLTVGGSMSADGGTNRVSAEAGNDSISLGGMNAANGGSNTVTSGAGDDTVSLVGGVSASANGNNEIDLGSGDNSLTVGGTVHADSGTNRISAEAGNDSISLGGMSAANGGSNTVNSGPGDDTVSVVGDVFASGNGSNDILLGTGDNNLTVGGSMSVDGGANRINAEAGNDSISLGGMSAANGGSNTVTSGAGDDTVYIVGGVSASGNGRNDILLGTGDNSLTLGGSMSADGGTNRVSAEGGKDNISLDGMSAANGGFNTVNSGGGDDTVSIVGGVSASGNGSNDILLETGDNILTVGGTVSADGGTNRVSAEDGNDSISLGGMNAANSGSNTVTSGAGVDTITIDGAITAQSGGKNYVNTGKDVGELLTINHTLTAHGEGADSSSPSENKLESYDVTLNSRGTAMAAQNSSDQGAARNIIDAANDAILNVSSGIAGAKGMHASAQAGGTQENSILAGNEVHVNVNLARQEGDSYGMHAQSGGGTASNTIDATGNINLNVYGAEGYEAWGMKAEGPGASNSLVSDGRTQVNLYYNLGNSTGMEASDGGRNSLTTKDKAMFYVYGVDGTGLKATGGGSNTVNVTTDSPVNIATDSLSIDVNVKGNGVGMDAATGGSNTLSAPHTYAWLQVLSHGGHAVGMRATGDGATESVNRIVADGAMVNVETKLDGGYVTAMLAQGQGGKNIVISGKEAAINAYNYVGAGDAIAMHAVDGGSNSVSSDGFVTVNGHTQWYSAWGMLAENGGRNSIDQSGSARITAYSDLYAHAMSAMGGNNSVTSSGQVDIVVGKKGTDAHPHRAYAMVMEKGGTNSVDAEGNVKVEVMARAYDPSVIGDSHAYGIYGREGSSSISSDRKVTMSVENKDGKATGIYLDAFESINGQWEERASNATISGQDVELNITTGGKTLLSSSDPTSKSDIVYEVDARGAYSWGNLAHAKLSATNKLDINVTAPQARTYGLYAENGGKITAEGKTVNINSTTDGATVYYTNPYGAVLTDYEVYAVGVKARNLGSVVEINGQNISVLAKAMGGNAYGVYAELHSNININGRENEANNFTFEAQGKNAHAIYSSDLGKTNLSTGGVSITGGNLNDKVTIRAIGDDWATGMLASSASHNRVDGGAGVDTLSLSVRAEEMALGMVAGPSNTALWGGSDCTNVIANFEQVDITASALKEGDAYGMFIYTDTAPGNTDPAYDSNHNKILLGEGAKGVVNLTAKAVNGDATAMFAKGRGVTHGYNEIAASSRGSDIKVTATSQGGEAIGMHAERAEGHNYIRGGSGNDKVTVTVDAFSNAYGMLGTSDSNHGLSDWSNHINTGSGSDTVSLNVTSSRAGAYGMYAQKGVSNAIESRYVDLNVRGYTTAYAMIATGTGSRNYINGDYKTTINASSADAATALYATGSQSGNEIRGNGDVIVSALSDGAYRTYGLFAENGATNTIAAGGNVQIKSGSASQQSLEAFGLIARGPGAANSVSGKQVDIEAYGRTGAFGIYAQGSVNTGASSNSVTAETLNVVATASAGKAHGIDATYGSNTITADTTVRVTGTGSNIHQATGLYAQSGNSNSVTGKLDVTVTHTGGKAYGIFDTLGGSTFVTSQGKDISLTVRGTTESRGIHTQGESISGNVTKAETSLDAGGGDIRISANGGAAYGMYTMLHGTTTLKNASNVHIEAIGTSARALFATGEDAKNIIEAGEGPIKVTIIAQGGNAFTSFAMRAEQGGLNSIRGGAGDDTISLTGAISSVQDGSRNEIRTGAGNDRIELAGTVSGNFTVDGGSGYDVLVLKAASVAEFTTRYGTWLGDLSNLQGVEAVHFEGLTHAQVTGNTMLNNLLNNLNGHGVTVVFGEYQDAASVLDGVLGAADHASYMGDFDTDHNLGGSSVEFKDGADSLSFEGKLTNGMLDTGAGNDLVRVEGGLEDMILNLGQGNDHLYINGRISNVVLQGGDGVDVLHLQNYDSISVFEDLAGNGNSLSGFEIIDLTGGNGTELTVDALLSGIAIDSALREELFASGNPDLVHALKDQGALRVIGDTGDSVRLAGDWHDADVLGTVIYDGVQYQVFANNDSEYLLVQSHLNVL